MWINITKNIFEKSDFKGLNFLYQILSYYPSTSSRPRYNIIVDLEKIKNTPNFKKLESIEPNVVSFLEDELNYYVTSSSTPYKITSKKGEFNYNVEEAVLFLNQPVSIILENNKNDAEFILAIIKHFGKNDGYNKAQEHIFNAWLQFQNAGGCTNIPNFIEGFLNQFKAIAIKNNRNLLDYFRGIIIVDSDKEYKNQSIKAEHKKLLEKLSMLGVNTSEILNEATGEILNNNANFHILEKRMMENYLPKEVYLEIKRQVDRQENQDLKDWLTAYLNLSNKEQLDFLNIPDGFPPKEKKFENNIRKPVSIDILNLFELNKSDIHFEKLDKGFNFKGFDDRGDLNSSKDFNSKNEMPKWFKKEIITKKNLEERDGENELEHILQKINNLL